MNRERMPRWLKGLGAAVIGATVTTCSWQAAPLKLDATVRFSKPTRDALPEISCAFVVVSSPNSSGDFSPAKAGLTNTCLPSGIASSLVSLETLEPGIRMQVTAGKAQKIFVLGVPSKTSCDGKTKPLELFTSPKTTIFELGSITADLLAGSKVDVPNTYKATSVDLVACPADASSGTLTLTAPRVMIHNGETLPVTASGGTGTYTYAVSGTGSISASGELTAVGPAGTNLTVTATDSDGATATITFPIVAAGQFLPGFSAVPRSMFSGYFSSVFGSMALQPDGKVLLAASTKLNGSDPELVTVVRLFKDGTLDAAFGVNGQMTYHNPDFTVYVPSAIGTQYEDGQLKIYVGGKATTPGAYAFVLKLNDDGTPVAGYGNTTAGPIVLPGWLYLNLGVPVTLKAIGFQTVGASKGHVVVSLNRTGEPNVVVGKLDPAGTDATGFLSGWGDGTGKMTYDLTSYSITAPEMSSLIMLPNDDFVVGGRMAVSSNVRFGMVGFLATGSLNLGFAPSTGILSFPIPSASYAEGNAAVLQELSPGAHRMVIVGSGFSGYNDLSLAGVTLAGVLDNSFHPLTAGTYVDQVDSETDYGQSVCVQTYDRKILVAGAATSGSETRTFITRYDPNAIGRDTSFGTGGAFFQNHAELSLPTLGQVIASPEGYLFAAGDRGAGVRDVYLIGLWQ